MGIKVKVAGSAEVKPDLVSKAIMFFTRAKYSHLYIVYKGIMYHCVDRGVCAEVYEYFLYPDHIEVESIEVELKCSEDEFHGYMRELIGKRIEYSHKQYIGFILPFARKWLRNERNKGICSEMVCWVLSDLGTHEFVDADFLHPKQVMQILLEKSKEI